MKSKNKNNLTAEFIEQITRNQSVVHKICNVYANSREEREDLKQEIILQLWKSYSGFRGKSQFSTWMYRIAFNTAITNIRKPKKHPIVEALSGAEQSIPAVEDIEYMNDDLNSLFKAIAELKEVEKAIIMLYLEEKSYREIGEIIGITEKNVSVKLVRLKEKLKQIMNEDHA